MRSFSNKVKTQDAVSAIRVGVSVGLPLCALYAAGRLDIAAYAAFGSLTSLYGHSESAQRRVETQMVVAAGIVATIAAAAIYSAAQGPVWLLGIMLAGVVAGAGTLGAVMGWVPRGEIFFILVLLVIAGVPLKPEHVPLAIATGAGGAGFAVLLTLLGPKGALRVRPMIRRVRARAMIGSATLDVTQHLIVIVAAVAGVLCAWLLALALHIGHPFWSPITVAALMPALTSADITRRTVQLMLGTITGVCFAALLFSAEPGVFALIVLIALCQAVAELFVARNYAIALIFISPLAIGMSNLGRNLPWDPLLAERLVEAGLGSAVALVTIVIGRAVLAKAAPLARMDSAS
ncbi:FUSC family protein [Aquabacter sp. CN5-332]|uniref:FUSC family protein n=1 Tax=Aquabacter sp. CN5-332 TaxID=3156608 RepID=UPI0032B49C1E